MHIAYTLQDRLLYLAIGYIGLVHFNRSNYKYYIPIFASIWIACANGKLLLMSSMPFNFICILTTSTYVVCSLYIIVAFAFALYYYDFESLFACKLMHKNDNIANVRPRWRRRRQLCAQWQRVSTIIKIQYATTTLRSNRNEKVKCEQKKNWNKNKENCLRTDNSR